MYRFVILGPHFISLMPCTRYKQDCCAIANVWDGTVWKGMRNEIVFENLAKYHAFDEKSH
jgi:hypothetical protein